MALGQSDFGIYTLGLTSYERAIITDICKRPFRKKTIAPNI